MRTRMPKHILRILAFRDEETEVEELDWRRGILYFDDDESLDIWLDKHKNKYKEYEVYDLQYSQVTI